MITSHTGWDLAMPPPRGGNRHAVEIAQLWVPICEVLRDVCTGKMHRRVSKAEANARANTGTNTGTDTRADTSTQD